jgi:hypothetical protein
MALYNYQGNKTIQISRNELLDLLKENSAHSLKGHISNSSTQGLANFINVSYEECVVSKSITVKRAIELIKKNRRNRDLNDLDEIKIVEVLTELDKRFGETGLCETINNIVDMYE